MFESSTSLCARGATRVHAEEERETLAERLSGTHLPAEVVRHRRAGLDGPELAVVRRRIRVVGEEEERAEQEQEAHVLCDPEQRHF
eukprot:COSAG04_NODE_3645_length_2642_cov_1.444750_2_plen_86_part_00